MDFLKLQNMYKITKAKIYTRLLRSSLGGLGKKSTIFPPFHANDLSELYIGDDCQIWFGGWIDAVKSHAGTNYSPRIDIGDKTYIGRNCHIIACDKMKIGKEVLIADNVYITDNFHNFEDIQTSILCTPLISRGRVTIEDQAWLGERVCVMPGVSIGRHSVVGSNSVVTRDIPPYSVAVGSPAEVIKKYDGDKKIWMPC